MSEILIKLTTESDQLKLIEEVERKIQEIGFDNAANTYSISNTANKGGKIGWVNESSLSSIIVKEIKNLKIRFRTLGDITITGGIESEADTLEKIVAEVAAIKQTERGNRSDDKRSETAMEDRKREGYF